MVDVYDYSALQRALGEALDNSAIVVYSDGKSLIKGSDALYRLIEHKRQEGFDEGVQSVLRSQAAETPAPPLNMDPPEYDYIEKKPKAEKTKKEK